MHLSIISQTWQVSGAKVLNITFSFLFPPVAYNSATITVPFKRIYASL